MINSVSFNEELKNNANMRKEDIHELRMWGNKQQNLSYKLSDSDLALFLHCNYYDMNATKNNIENYFRMRFFLPEFFAERDPVKSKSLQQIFNTVTIIPLDKLTEEGYKVIYTKLIDTDPDNYVFTEAVKFLNMVLDLCVYEDGTNNGYVLVFDINGVRLKHLSNLKWFDLKKFFEYTKKGCPIRWKGLYYISSSFICNSIQELLNSKILGQKFADTIYFYPNFEKFNEVIPIDVFPDEMGGKAGPLMKLHEAQINKLKSRQDWFLSIDSNMTIAEKNQLKKNNIADMFGMNSDLRELNID